MSGRKRRIAALTVHQPWASLIALGSGARPKRVENRTWTPGAAELSPGDYLAVHAGTYVTRHGQGADQWGGAVELYLARRGLVGPQPILDGLLAAPPRERGDRFDARERYARAAVPYGAVLAVATYAGWVSEPLTVGGEPDPWFAGPYAWVLDDVVALPEPVPCRGDRGLWPLPPDVLAAVRDGYGRAIGADAAGGAP